VYRDKAMVFLSMAEVLSELGTCDRAKVGAIIIMDGRCISWGYNGAPPGLPHCDETLHGWKDYMPETMLPSVKHKWLESQLNAHGCRATTHAEANALAFAARQGISTAGAALFTTVSPCETCAKSIIASGIKDVHFLTEYRDPTGVQLLDKGEVYTHNYGQ
jgi:dCMP deaminase